MCTLLNNALYSRPHAMRHIIFFVNHISQKKQCFAEKRLFSLKELLQHKKMTEGQHHNVSETCMAGPLCDNALNDSKV